MLNDDTGFDDTQKTLMEILQETAQEMEQAQDKAKELRQGLAFLRQISDCAFSAVDEEITLDGNVVLRTAIPLKRGSGTELMSLTVTPSGDISSNAPSAAGSPEGKDSFAVSGFDEFEVDDRLKEAFAAVATDQQAPEKTSPSAILTHTGASAALIEVARLAVLYNIATEEPSTGEQQVKAVTAAEQAVVEGLRRGREEIKEALAAKDDHLWNGLQFMEARSQGGLKIDWQRLNGTSDIEIRIRGIPAKDFQPLYIKVTASGMMKTGKATSDSSPPVYDAAELDALKEAHVTAVLAAFAKEAAFAGKIPLPATPRYSGDENNTAQKAAFKGLLDAARIVWDTRTRGYQVIDGLEELQKIAIANGGSFRVEEKKLYKDGSVTMVINPRMPNLEAEVTIDTLGQIKVSKDPVVYTEAGAAMLLAKIAREATLRRLLSAPNTTGPTTGLRL